MTKTRTWEVGFTISELLVVMAIAIILWTLATMIFIRPQERVNLDLVVTTLAADIKAQQTKAMTGDGGSNYGIHFEVHRYILFTGTTYNSTDPNNFVVKVDSPVQVINITLTSSDLIFQKGSGETDISTGHDGLTIQNSSGGSSKAFVINKYGSIQEI
ncbi:hypothetical protein HY045_03885 [Candidatus Woesebacteria bacterium]|nr:hypothetical protein [Candidatus Woesebacteria bacterium]